MLDEQTIADLKRAGHGELTLLESEGLPDACLVVRTPRRIEYVRFRDEVLNDNRDALETLLRAIVVYPDAGGFDALLERYPALCEEFGREVNKLVGAAGKARARKL